MFFAPACLFLSSKEEFFMRLSIQNLSFTYDGSADPVFPGWSVELDTSWRLGLTGRNGRGKTTLLKLLCGQYPYQGKILMPLTPVYFPYPVADPLDLTIQVMEEASGGEPQWKLMRELKQLDLREDVLYRPFGTLSRGEMTKVLL
jgi:lincosamide and streptogramin A transport system ATP-binding/permease protein